MANSGRAAAIQGHTGPTGTTAGTAAESGAGSAAGSPAGSGFLWHDHPSPSSGKQSRLLCLELASQSRMEPHHHRFGPVTVGLPLVRWLDQVDQLATAAGAPLTGAPAPQEQLTAYPHQPGPWLSNA